VNQLRHMNINTNAPTPELLPQMGARGIQLQASEIRLGEQANVLAAHEAPAHRDWCRRAAPRGEDYPAMEKSCA
jgi:hypothetical protein